MGTIALDGKKVPLQPSKCSESLSLIEQPQNFPLIWAVCHWIVSFNCSWIVVRGLTSCWRDSLSNQWEKSDRAFATQVSLTLDVFFLIVHVLVSVLMQSCVVILCHGPIPLPKMHWLELYPVTWIIYQVDLIGKTHNPSEHWCKLWLSIAIVVSFVHSLWLDDDIRAGVAQ